MTDFDRVLYVRHPSGPGYPHAPLPGGFYAQAPVVGCPCEICTCQRMRQMFCRMCQNGGGLTGCLACGRSLWFTEPLFTDDPSLGA